MLKSIAPSRSVWTNAGVLYDVKERIGSGNFGKVYLGTRVGSKERVALKFIESSDEKMLARELNALVAVGNHAHIVSLLDYDAACIVPSRRLPGVVKERALFVMEALVNGNLFDYVQYSGPLQEPLACHYFRQALLAVVHCHANSVFHRDLKPENLMLDANFQLKLVDFGLAILAPPASLLKTPLGSCMFMAPEVRSRREYLGSAADVWSLGVTLFVLLTRSYPFPSEHGHWYWARVREGDFTSFWAAHDRTIPPLSPTVKDLLSKMMTFTPQARATVSQVVNHPWITHTPLPPPADVLDAMHKRRQAVNAALVMLRGPSAGFPIAAGPPSVCSGDDMTGMFDEGVYGGAGDYVGSPVADGDTDMVGTPHTAGRGRAVTTSNPTLDTLYRSKLASGQVTYISHPPSAPAA